MEQGQFLQVNLAELTENLIIVAGQAAQVETVAEDEGIGAAVQFEAVHGNGDPEEPDIGGVKGAAGGPIEVGQRAIYIENQQFQ